MMHEAGRNVLEDFVVITPYSNYPYIELVDPDNGNLFYISGRGGGEETSNELAGLLIGYSMPDPTTGIANPRQPIASTYLLDDMEMDRPLSAAIPMTLRQYIEGIVFDVGSKQIRYLGWRDEGNRMRRVLHTTKTSPEVLVYATDGQGRPVYADKPQRLKFRAVRYINNGLTFNICPPSLAPTEMANRLVSMSKTASGKGGGDNAFWDDATKKHIGWVVQMWRTVNPKVEITAIDINRMTANQDVIDAEVGKLKKFIKEKETRRKASIDPAESKMLDDELPILKDMLSYFDGEWATLDMKTKSNLIACITNLFGQFMSETKLRSTFCVPSSFSMETVMSSGKIFTLVAPGYEGAAKVFGTALKMEFQALLKRRLAQANYNKMRLVLFMCDEAQNYAEGSTPLVGRSGRRSQGVLCAMVALGWRELLRIFQLPVGSETFRVLARLGGGGPSEKRVVNDDLIPAAADRHDEHREDDELELVGAVAGEDVGEVDEPCDDHERHDHHDDGDERDERDERDEVSDHHRHDAGHDSDHPLSETVPAGRAAMQRRMLTLLPLTTGRDCNGNGRRTRRRSSHREHRGDGQS